MVQQIATLYAECVRQINKWKKFKIRRHADEFLRVAKAYNRLVALNRMPNLQIDTAKSIAARNIIAKT